jgi:hypothetical protein
MELVIIQGYISIEGKVLPLREYHTYCNLEILESFV